MLLIYDLVNEYWAFKFLKANHEVKSFSVFPGGVILVLRGVKEEKQYMKILKEFTD